MKLFGPAKILVLSVFICTFSAVAYAGNIGGIDSDNRFILNGRPFFPLGLYVVECPDSLLSELSEELDEIAGSPFDTLMNYGTNGCSGDATDDEILSYLDALESRNLKLIFPLTQYFDNDDADIDAITQKVSPFKDHPALLSWYLNDERDPSYLPQLEERYRTVAVELDRDHPVWSVHWNPDWLIQEAHTTDIVGVDSYPIDHLPVTAVSDVADRAVASGKPLWLVPQIFDWTDYPGDAAGRDLTGRAPTREEMRAMTYLATNHGARGLLYYSYFNIRDDVDFEERWPEIKEIASEVRRLRHVFISADVTNSADVSSTDPDVDFRLMRQGSTYYLFAVNTKVDEQGEPVTAPDVAFIINVAPTPDAIHVLFEDDRPQTVIDVFEGVFTDDFEPYEVHIYQWQEDSEMVASVESENITSLTVNAVNPDAPEFNTTDKPENLIHGLIDMEAEAETAGAVAVITVRLPSAAPAGYRWFKFTPDGEWQDFGREFGAVDGAEFNEDRSQVTLFITDNGSYDDDLRDMVIRGASGLGTAATLP